MFDDINDADQYSFNFIDYIIIYCAYPLLLIYGFLFLGWCKLFNKWDN